MLKIKREWALLLCIFVAAFAVRMTTFKYFLLGFDPFHHYAIGKFIAAGNGFPDLWELSNYPNGAAMGEPAGLYYTSVYLYWILKPFGISYLSAFKLSPPIFGVLTILPAYLIVNELFNRKVALYSAILLGFIPAFMYRTFSGFYRGDTFSVFFMVLGFYLFLKSTESEMKKGVGYAISAGVCFGLMGLVWNGFLFGFIVLSSFLIVYCISVYLYGGDARRAILAYVISVGLGIALIKYFMVQHPLVENYMNDLIRYVYPLTIIISLFFESIKYQTGSFPLKNRFYLLLFFALASAFIAYQYFEEVVRNLITGYGVVKASGSIMPTIGELRSPTNEVLWLKYGISGILAILGTLYVLKENRLQSKVFLVVWLLASVFIMKMAVRYTFIASPPIAIVGALFLYKIEKEFPRKETRIATAAVLVFITITGIAFAVDQNAHITPQWIDAAEFLQSQERGGVFTWWDYGSWIQGISGFPTNVDTVHGQNPSKIRQTGRIFLEEDEEKLYVELGKLKIDYLVVPVDMIGQMTNLNFILGDSANYQYPLFVKTGEVLVNDVPAEKYGNNLYLFNIQNGQIVAVEDDGKLYAFKRVYWREGDSLLKREHQTFSLPLVDRAVYISRNDLFIPNSNVNDFMIPIEPEIEKTLLTSLMLLDGEGFDGVELVYRNSEVKIYKLNK